MRMNHSQQLDVILGASLGHMWSQATTVLRSYSQWLSFHKQSFAGLQISGKNAFFKSS